MDEKEFLGWLDKEDLLNLAKKYSNHFANVFRQCLDVKKEKILLLGDFGYPTRRIAPLLTAGYYLAAKSMNLDVDFALQDPKRGADKAEPSLVKKLFELPEQSAVIVNMSGKVGNMDYVGKSFRKFCITHNNRFVSTTSLGTMDTFVIKSVIDALSIDYNKMQSEDKILKSNILSGKTMNIKTRAGTDLTIELKKPDIRIADGDYKKFGIGGNLPAGEVYFAPYNANGKVIIDASSRNMEGAVLIQKPIEIIIQDNKIVAIKGEQEARILDESIKQAEKRAKFPERIRHLAEIGIGTNLKAKVIGSTIIDEKTYGTAHIAIGSNYWFGGTNRTIIHYDQVFRNPRIKIDGKPLRF